MNTGPAFFDSSGAAGTPPLDAFVSLGIYRAYGLRRLLTSYTGPLVKVRDSTTGVSYDIGYDGTGALDTATLAANIGANSATVSLWYDQSGAADDFSKTGVPAQQPLIYSAGSYLGKLVFDGVDDDLQAVAGVSPTSGMTVLMKMLRRNTTHTDVHLCSVNVTTSGFNGLEIYSLTGVTGDHAFVGENGTANDVDNAYSSTGTLGVKAIVLNRAGALAADKTKLYEAGSASTPGGGTTAGSLPTGSFTADALALCSTGTTNFAPDDVYNFASFNAALGPSDVTAISAVLA